jgi:hypothetical protein
MPYIPGIPPYSFTTQIHFLNTIAKLSDKIKHSNKTKGCITYIRASQTSSVGWQSDGSP